MALERSAPPTTWRAFEVIWVNSSILAVCQGGALEEIQATISRILRVRRPIDGVSDGNRGLASARDHVVVVRIQLLQMVQVNTGHHKGAYRRRGHIKHNFARLSEDGCVLHMCSGSRSVKDNPDFRVPRHCLNAFDGGLKPQARSPPDSLRLHDARHGLHLPGSAALPCTLGPCQYCGPGMIQL